MLPAPPASCAGWWFAQLWRALLQARPERLGVWTLNYQGTTTLLAHPDGADPRLEVITGTLQEDTERRLAVSWEWPGDDGMAHAVSLSWQPGEHLVRPLEWTHQRRPLQFTGLKQPSVPWPLSISLSVRGWNAQLLELAEIRAEDTDRAYPVQWDPPPGIPRLPRTELPSTLSSLENSQMPADLIPFERTSTERTWAESLSTERTSIERTSNEPLSTERTWTERTSTQATPTLTLAGLSLPWRIDLNQASWPIWRRLSGSLLLNTLGGPTATCPRHGPTCPWPETGQNH